MEMNTGQVNDVVSSYVCHLVPVCYVSLQYLILYFTSHCFTLIGTFHSSNELYSLPVFELGDGVFGLTKLCVQINIFNITPVI